MPEVRKRVTRACPGRMTRAFEPPRVKTLVREGSSSMSPPSRRSERVSHACLPPHATHAVKGHATW
eukprot:scaffold134679_cov27-Tisochrysis_lutea.AAC.6